MYPINMNTVKALLKDELDASRQYAKLATKETGNKREMLLAMSADEARHAKFWQAYMTGKKRFRK